MRKKLFGIVSLAAVSVLIAGCSSTTVSAPDRVTTTGIALSQNNFKLLKSDATGTSHGFALLGLIPIVSPQVATAKEELYATVGQPLTGKAVALANQTESRSTVYLILFSVPKLTITADVIEFTDNNRASASDTTKQQQ